MIYIFYERIGFRHINLATEWFSPSVGKQCVPPRSIDTVHTASYYFEFDFLCNPLNIVREKCDRLIYERYCINMQPFWTSWKTLSAHHIDILHSYHGNECSINLRVKNAGIFIFTMHHLPWRMRIYCNALNLATYSIPMILVIGSIVHDLRNDNYTPFSFPIFQTISISNFSEIYTITVALYVYTKQNIGRS